MIRVPQRKYSPSALERWFQRLVKAWETTFSREELEAGREAYRQGDVRALELTDEMAVVHGGRAKDDVYAVIEWSDAGAPTVRHSVSDARIGRSLAVAGLYEIEEFVAEEVGALPIAEEATKAAAEPVAAPPPPPKPSGPPGRALEVAFTSTARGLQMRARWAGAKNGDSAFRSKPRVPRERENLIALTSRAHQASFDHRSFSGDYVLRDPGRIVSFVRDELPRWRKRFEIQLDPSVSRLGKGVRPVEIGLRLDRGEGGIAYSWSALAGGAELSEAVRGQLLRHPGQTIIDPEFGLLELSAEQRDWIEHWYPLLEERFGGVVPSYMLFSLAASEVIPVEMTPSLRDWRADIEAAKGTKMAGLPRWMRSYQRAGIRWMRQLLEAGCHPLLADEMSLGKTVQVLGLIHADPQWSKQASLVVCPASVIPVWEAEVRRFFPAIRTRVLTRGNAFADPRGADIWLASYSQLRRHRDRLGELEFAYAVLDEAQMIKNPDAKVSQACSSIAAKYRIAMTGTPIENRHLDVWTIFRFLMPGLLGGRRVLERGLAEDMERATARIRRQITPFVIRRTKAKVRKELPEKVEMVLPCPLTPVQVAEYRRLVEEGVEQLGARTDEALRSRPLPLLSLLTRLRQVSCDPGLLPWRNDGLEQSGKLLTLCDRLEGVFDSGRKAVVFSQFVRFLDRADAIIGERFPGVSRHHLRGSTVNREAPVRAFQEGEGAAVILVSLKAGGTGITLHAADYVFLLDPWWNPAVEAQAIDRVHRIGQRNRVMVYRLVTHETVEGRIEALKDQKRDLFESISSDWRGAINWSEQYARLEDLIAYRAEGLDEPDGDPATSA